MSVTAFKDHSDNASAAIAASGELNNTTSPITLNLATGKGALFATIANGEYVTIWDKTTYADPIDDPQMEKATLTARTGDSITLTRPNAVTHAGTPYVAELIRKVHLTDIEGAVNTAETGLASVTATVSALVVPKITFECVVAATGGDYTTLGAALVAGKASIFIKKGTYTEDSSLNTYTAAAGRNYHIVGEDQAGTIIQIGSNTNAYFSIKAAAFISNLTIQTPNNLNIGTTLYGWVKPVVSNILFDNVSFCGTNSANSTQQGIVSIVDAVRSIKFRDCLFFNENNGQTHVIIKNGDSIYFQNCYFNCLRTNKFINASTVPTGSTLNNLNVIGCYFKNTAGLMCNALTVGISGSGVIGTIIFQNNTYVKSGASSHGYLISLQVYLPAAGYAIVTGNTVISSVTGSNGLFVYLGYNGNIIFSNNYFEQTGACTAFIGAMLGLGYTTLAIISNNTFRCSGSGVGLIESAINATGITPALSKTIISNNIFSGFNYATTGAGIAIGQDASYVAATNVTIDGNVYDNCTNTVYYWGTSSIDATSQFQIESDLAHKRAVGRIGFFGIAPAVRATAYTQTYSTASKTVAAPTVAAVATTGSTITTPYGYTTSAQADAIPTAINALAADVLNIEKNVTAIIDDLQAYGLLQ